MKRPLVELREDAAFALAFAGFSTKEVGRLLQETPSGTRRLIKLGNLRARAALPEPEPEAVEPEIAPVEPDGRWQPDFVRFTGAE